MSDHAQPLSACQRWLSRRALILHLALLVWFPGCLVAFWWQVHRALGGNALSYLYSVEWPAFAIAGVWVWWQLVHTEPSPVGRPPHERLAGIAPARDAGAKVAGSPLAGAARPHPARRREEEDPELAAYNDRLARLAAEGPKGWRRR
ncbi:MAG: hypothetical protein M0010_00575 [Actinomycetota bacterium]|nr:hypothetical protein [Actinomycetota bacterium]